MTHASISFSETPAVPAFPLSPALQSAPRRSQAAARTAGMMVRRPDLSDEAILGAIAERLTFEGRDPAHAAGVLKAAMEGRHAAKAMMRKLVLPAPQSSLSMPTQSILRERTETQRSSSWLRLVSFGR